MVSSLLGVATSGLISTGLATQMRANNTVNVLTEDFETTQPVRQSLNPGVKVVGQRGGRIALSNELLGFMQEEYSFKSSATVFRAVDEMYKKAVELKK